MNRNKLLRLFVRCVAVDEMRIYFVAQITINRRGWRKRESDVNKEVLRRAKIHRSEFAQYDPWHGSTNLMSEQRAPKLYPLAHSNTGQHKRLNLCTCINAIKTEILFQMSSNAAYGYAFLCAAFFFLFAERFSRNLLPHRRKP